MINSYRFGHIVVDGKPYTADIIILSGRIISQWWRKSGHELSLDDIKEVLGEKPDVLIVGTGANGMMRVLPEVEKKLSSLKVELIAEPTAEACKTFNAVSAKKKTAAALHLTC